MKAVVISSFGAPEVLEIQERDIPSICDAEVLIQVKAAGVNRPDIFQRKGNYPAPAGVDADIPGLEVAGIVYAVGDKVNTLRIGQPVMALVAGAGYAEYVAVDEGSCIPIPDNLSFEEAAGMPETLFTVWHNVFQRGGLKKDEKFLVHGGAGGIGITAIQLANLLGCEVFTTVGSDKKKQFVENIGATMAVNYHTDDFEEVFKSKGIHVVLDSIGGEYFNKNINVLQEEGRLVQINAMDGAKVNLNLFKLMQKRIFLTGSTLRNRSKSFKTNVANEIKEYVMPLVADGSYRTYIEQVLPIEDVVKAHHLMESRNFIGKIILVF